MLIKSKDLEIIANHIKSLLDNQNAMKNHVKKQNLLIQIIKMTVETLNATLKKVKKYQTVISASIYKEIIISKCLMNELLKKKHTRMRNKIQETINE